MRTSALFDAKSIGFFEIIVYRICTDKEEGWFRQFGHFVNREEGSIFRDFMLTSFMYGP